MASAVIHLCIAKQINEKLKLDEKLFFLGNIAPDISKQIGTSREKSHFLSRPAQDIPNIDEFLDKYKQTMSNPFNLGYFVHLWADKLWFKEYVGKKRYNDSLKLLDGTIISLPFEESIRLIYGDYTNMNIALLDEYNLDLSLFYEELPLFESDIDEIPIDKLQVLVDKMGLIIKNTQEKKSYVFDIHSVKHFIDDSVDKILQKIDEYKLLDK